MSVNGYHPAYFSVIVSITLGSAYPGAHHSRLPEGVYPPGPQPNAPCLAQHTEQLPSACVCSFFRMREVLGPIKGPPRYRSLELKRYFLLQVVLTALNLEYDRCRIRLSNRVLI